MKMKSILLCALALGGICAFGGVAKEAASVGEGSEVVGGYTWSYSIRGGGASIEAPGGKYVSAVSPSPEGEIVIPAKLGGVAVTRIGRAAFTRCRSVTAVTIPSTVTSIGKSAFYECGIRSVTIPRGVKSIEDLAFYHSSLKSVIIPEGVTNIGGSAFGDCWGIESVTIPSSVTSIGRRAFSCDSRRMNSIVVSPNNKKFAVYDNLLCTKDGKSVIAGIGGDVTIPSSVTSIDEYAFYKCRGLTSVTIPSSVKMIGNSAFEWCESVESFHVSPENRAFASPNGILCSKDGKTVIAGVNGDVVIPDGVTRIDESAFTGRRWLTSVKIPASVKIFGDEVFRCCKGLVSVTMCGERPRATRGVFDYCEKLKAIHVPADSRSWEGLKTWQGIPLVFDGEKSVVGQVKCVDVGGSSTSKRTPGENLVAQKLRKCNFLLNKNFKKDAKFYLCLFSASWCGPCRREMPRIAKTYAETLKDDPDIELIHFSRDQNDEKAMAWAKEHDVKFPVVKPKGGNPLDLHARGIPHLFIVKADGTLVEEGHPMRIFNEEKFRELKGGGATDGAKPQEDKACSSATEGVTNVTTEGGLFALTGPYGIRMTADPGCEKGAEYVMKRLVEHYLPRAKEFYGDPFLGEKPSRTYRIDVRRNDGLGNSTYTGPSYGPGTGRWSIGLSKGADRFEMSLDYLASSVLTLCEEPKWASFVFYVNRFVEAKAKGIDAAPRLKEDIRRGLEDDDEDGKDNWYRSHAPLWAALEDLRTKHPKLILDYCALKNKRFSEGKLPKKLSLDQMAALLSEVSGENASELFNKYGVKDSSAKRK